MRFVEYILAADEAQTNPELIPGLELCLAALLHPHFLLSNAAQARWRALDPRGSLCHTWLAQQRVLCQRGGHGHLA